ncbi:ash family protein [Salmonella enterica]|nr:ash family protein [Salmonella enterica]EEI6534212.1 host cell division inhibitor Icd-like protein [Salmonella enterica]
MVWWLIVFFYFLRHIISIMVVQAGQLSGWPVSFRAGIPTPVWATTHERRNSGGSVTRYLKEVAIMAIVPALSHPEFTFVFLAVRRTDRNARPRPVRVIADCEHAARLKLATEFILSFAARIPVKNAGEVVA